jgi:hypothetical protein
MEASTNSYLSPVQSPEQTVDLDFAESGAWLSGSRRSSFIPQAIGRTFLVV